MHSWPIDIAIFAAGVLAGAVGLFFVIMCEHYHPDK